MNKNSNNDFITLQVNKQKIGPVLARHPWVFSGALTDIPENIKSGQPVKLVDSQNNFLACGYFNSYSQIAVRIWSYSKDEKIDMQFFEKRIKNALQIRSNYLDSKKTNAYRLINSENDFLPGFIADRYGDYLVVQFHTEGIEMHKNKLISALEKILKPKGIYERSDKLRKDNQNKNFDDNTLFGKIPDIIKIKENGLLFYIDVKTGQKPDFFLISATSAWL